MKPSRTAPTEPPVVILTGTIAGVPHLGGLTWVALNQMFGLIQAGCDAHLIEPISTSQLVPPGTGFADSENARYFRGVVDAYGLADSATLLCTDTGETIGATLEELIQLGSRCSALLNVGGMLDVDCIAEPIPVRAYIDLDPGFTQLWALQGVDMRFDDHTHFVTVGSLLGQPVCDIPTAGRRWIGMLPPVSLAHWHPPDFELTGDAVPVAFTTVASWRGYGSVWHDGVHYGQKAHTVRALFDLPDRTAESFELALEIHPDERDDIAAFTRHHWSVVDPADVAGTPLEFQRFVYGSKGEIGFTKLGYVAGRTGWFSDRSVCYLAAGRPVVAHDTGFVDTLPTRDGLLTFTDLDSAVAAVADVAGDYERHSRAARLLAETYFDAGVVMGRLLDELGVT